MDIDSKLNLLRSNVAQYEKKATETVLFLKNKMVPPTTELKTLGGKLEKQLDATKALESITTELANETMVMVSGLDDGKKREYHILHKKILDVNKKTRGDIKDAAAILNAVKQIPLKFKGEEPAAKKPRLAFFDLDEPGTGEPETGEPQAGSSTSR